MQSHHVKRYVGIKKPEEQTYQHSYITYIQLSSLCTTCVKTDTKESSSEVRKEITWIPYLSLNDKTRSQGEDLPGHLS